MDQQPLFSVLCTNYNNGQHIPDMVHSLVSQTYENWELIFVDDGSTDASVSIISTLQDPRIQIHPLPTNQGAGAAAHKAAGLAAGEFWGRLDADDALVPEAISVMVQAHLENPQVSLITSQIIACTEELKPCNPAWHTNSPIPEGSCILRHPTVGAFATFKKRHFLKTEGFDPKIARAVDLDLYLKLEEVGSILDLNYPLYLYRRNPIGISQGHNGTLARALAYRVMLSAYHRRRKSFSTTQNISRNEAKQMRIRQHQIDLHHQFSGWKSIQSMLNATKAFPELLFSFTMIRNTISAFLRGLKTTTA